MQIIVKKFGGTSLASITRINRAVTYIKNTLNKYKFKISKKFIFQKTI